MIKLFKKYFSKVPTPIAGLSLGVSSLGICLENMYDFNNYAQLTFAIFSLLLLLILTLKFICFPRYFFDDLSHPVTGSILPTISMTIMVLSTTINKYSFKLGLTFWVLGIIIHLCFLLTFLFFRIREFKLHHMIPSWFVPPVGIIVSAVTFPNLNSLLPLTYFLMLFGITTYLTLLPLMLYRIIFETVIPKNTEPTLAIFAAPPSISLAGYLTISSQPDIVVISILSSVSIFMTALVYLFFLKSLFRSFHPSYAAFTFPLVISSVAMFKLSDWIQSMNFLTHYENKAHIVAEFEGIVALFAVFYVLMNYLKLLINNFFSIEMSSKYL